MKQYLTNNKLAMDMLKHMANDGRTDKYIQQKLREVIGYSWHTRTIGDRRRALGIRRTTTINKPATPLSCPAKSNLIKNSFNKLDPNQLSFNELCEYVISFFEDLANYPRGERAPNHWWKIISSKLRIFDKKRIIQSINFGIFTQSQMYAYNFCTEGFDRLISRSSCKGQCQDLYDLYRKWRNSFLKSLHMKTVNTIYETTR
ncbi:MAG: hypothetical protein JSW11_00500 [Candidatus Heimdallarchaeota archaeon]|nr:MAG: hypothetical protein JSW11_00500 [Candidatus Heimdallarchaeota archaeon]